MRAAAITEFPLRVEFSRHFYTDQIELSLDYHTAVFDANHIDRMGKYIVKILELMVSETNQPHNAHSFLSQDELTLLEDYSRNQKQTAQVMDRFGNLVPIGTPGQIVLAGEKPAQTGRNKPGCWLPGGVLHEGNPEMVLEKPAIASSIKAHQELSSNSAEIMSKIVHLWADVLKIPPEKIRPEDDFFEIGGNSLAALRVSLLLNNAISLTDVMRYSRLAELVSAIEKSSTTSASVNDDLLIELTNNSKQALFNIVCFPYAGGNAAHFKPFADSLTKTRPDIAVFSVELPGHDYKAQNQGLKDFNSTTRLIADEIGRKIRGPVIIWGHCVGTALAVEVTKLLQERNINVRHLFLAAKLLYPAEEISQTIQNAEQVTFSDIRDLYMEWTGSDDINSLGHQYETFLAKVFQHDSLEANRYLLTNRKTTEIKPLSVPCTFVAAKDDTITEGYESNYQNWQHMVKNIQLHE